MAGSVVLSLEFGNGNTLTRGQNEVCRCQRWNTKNIHTYDGCFIPQLGQHLQSSKTLDLISEDEDEYFSFRF